MANGTGTLTPPEDEQKQKLGHAHDPAQEEFNRIIEREYPGATGTGSPRKAAPSGGVATDLENQELKFGGSWKPDTADLATRENPTWKTTFINPDEQAEEVEARGGGVSGFFRGYKRRLIIGLSIGGSITALISFLLGGAGMVPAIKALTDKYGDKFGISANYRKQTHIKKRYFKIDPACTGSTSARCKLSKGITEKEVNKLKKAGVLLDEDVVRENGKIRIKAFTAYDTDGKPFKVTEDNFDKHYRENPRFRGGMDRVNNARALWWRSAKSLYNYVKFKVNRKNPIGDSGDQKKIEEDYRKGTQGSPDDETGVKDQLASDHPDEDDAAAAEAAEEDVEKQNATIPDPTDLDEVPETSAADSARKVTRATLGGVAFGAISAIDNVCKLNRYLRNLVVGAKILAAAQLIRYAAVFLTLADMLKSGDANYAQIGFVAGLLITPSRAPSSKGKTFFNSEGWGLISQGKVTDKRGLARFTTGTPALKFLTKFRSTVNGLFSRLGLTPKVCKIEQKWYSQLFLGFIGIGLGVLTGGGFTVVGVAISVAAGVSISVIAQLAAPLIIKYLAGTLAPSAKDIAGGYAVGNAFAAGVGALSLWKHGKTHGLHPATKTEFSKLNAQADADYRSFLAGQNYGKNPFSLDNPDSITSRIQLALAPYTAAPLSTGGLQQTALTLMNPIQLVLGSGASILSNKALAADDAYGSKYCDDEEYQKMPNGPVMTDAFCNPIYVGAQYMPYEEVFDWLKSHDHIDDSGAPTSEDFQDFIKICINGEYPLSPEEGDGETPDTRRCANNADKDKEDYYRQWIDYDDYIAAIEKNADGTLGQDEGGAGFNGSFDAAQCAALSDLGAKVACNATAFDDYKYLWGGGHGSLDNLKAIIKKVVDGEDKFSDTVDCSGLVRAAYFMAYGVDIGGGTAATQAHSKFFKPVSKDQAKAGDIVWHNSPADHIGIVMENNPSKKTWKIFNASSAKKSKETQIESRTASYNEFETFTYTGEK